MLVYLLIFIVCVCVLLMRKRKSGVPELPGKWPIVGHGLKFIGNAEHHMNMVRWAGEECIKRGGVATIESGFIYRGFMIADPEDFAIVAAQCLQKSPVYYVSHVMFGNSMLYSKLPKWKQQRKLFSPAFGPQMMNSYLRVFNEQGRRLVQQLAATCNGEPFDHTHVIMINNLETSLQTITGYEINEALDLCEPYLHNVETIFNTFIERGSKFWLLSEHIFRFSKLKKVQEDCLHFIRKTCQTAIEQRKLKMAATGEAKSILDCILQHNKGEDRLSDEEIRDQLILLTIGAYDTTASFMICVLTVIGTYPEVQQKLYDEIINVAGDRDVNKLDLSRLVYLDAVIKETLRLYPTVPMIARYNKTEIHLRNYTIPKHNTIILMINGIHRHPSWGPDKDQFRPERWPDTLPAAATSFAPFSMGKRNCIGKTYAMMSMKTSLVYVLRHYKVTGDINKVKQQQHHRMYVYILIFITCMCVLLMRKRKSGVPELPGKWPIVGHGLKFIGNGEHIMNVVKWVGEECIKRGGVATFETGLVYKVYVVADPEDFAVVTSQCIHKSPLYFFANFLLGESCMLYSKLSKWKQQRKLLNPAFGSQMLNGFLQIFNDQGRRLVQQLALTSNGEPFDHTYVIMINNLETSLQTITGFNVDEAIEICEPYLHSMETIFDCFTERLSKFWLISEFIFKFSKVKKVQDNCTHFIRKTSQMALEQRKLRTGTIKQGEVTSILDFILEHNKGEGSLTDEEIKELLVLFVIAYDTSSSFLICILAVLGTYQEIQQKVYEEIITVVGDRDVSKIDLSRLVYLDAVVKETLRLYPSLPMIARYTNTDLQLRNHTIPKGHTVLLMIHGIQRHPVWGPDKDQFRPERWLKNTLPAAANSFVAFSIGRRNCIGKTYAMMSMKTSLVHALRHYKVTGDITKIKYGYEVMMKPVSGNFISLEERKTVN